ncbi:hypothetical protein EJ07DRAFT_180683 [Lizonia empirigonia]|nr:hypothetical protein EJ07DRAFT_180683 [Lizonia empirigonia]
MPPKSPSTVPAALEPTTNGTDDNTLARAKSDNRNADANTAPYTQVAKTKRSRYRGKRRRSTKSHNSTAGDAASTTTEGVTDIETGRNNEVEAVEASNHPVSSPPSDTDTIATEPLPQFRLLPQPPAAQSTVVPVLGHYELRETCNTGDDEGDPDQGLFATQMIEQGTRIISERPLFTLPAPGNQLTELMAAYDNLPKSEQDRVWNLRAAAAAASDQLRDLRYLIDRLASDLQNIMLKAERVRTQAEQATLEMMQPKLQHAANVWRIAARWHANRCSMTDLPEEQRASLPDGTPITGLFLERAQIRHSCVPNCFASYDASLGCMNVHVTRDIAEGEELTLSAFADNMYYKDAEDRSQELATWGLACSCEACDRQHVKFGIHEAARRRAHTRVVLLLDFLTRLEEAEFTEEELLEGQDMVLALIRDLKATGCESVETVRWRNMLVDRILPARALVIPDSDRLLAWQLLLRHAMECERVGRICYGEDREEFKVLQQTTEATQAWVDMAIAHEENEKNRSESMGTNDDEERRVDQEMD